MRLLLINGNMTQAVTDKVVAEARRIAAPGTLIEGVTATFGANIVTREAENVIAAHAVLDLLARHHAGFDAAILAISFDTGLEAARQVSPIPVYGMTEAALLAAADVGKRVGVISFGNISAPLYDALIARSPARARIAPLRVVEIASVGSYLDTGALEAGILAELAAAEAEGIDAAVICGAAMAGMAGRLQARSAIPLFDGIACAVRRAERALAAGVSVVPQKPMPAVRVEGVGPDLQRLLSGMPQS